MAKKTGRIIVAMQCTACKKVNYHTMINKNNTPSLELKKFCKQCRSVEAHKSREKLK